MNRRQRKKKDKQALHAKLVRDNPHATRKQIKLIVRAQCDRREAGKVYYDELSRYQCLPLIDENVRKYARHYSASPEEIRSAASAVTEALNSSEGQVEPVIAEEPSKAVCEVEAKPAVNKKRKKRSSYERD